MKVINVGRYLPSLLWKSPVSLIPGEYVLTLAWREGKKKKVGTVIIRAHFAGEHLPYEIEAVRIDGRKVQPW
jgi:hypothetical protein